MPHKPLQPEGDILAQDFIPSCSCLVLSHDTGELYVKAAPYPINTFLLFVLLQELILYWFATPWLPKGSHFVWSFSVLSSVRARSHSLGKLIGLYLLESDGHPFQSHGSCHCRADQSGNSISSSGSRLDLFHSQG